MGSFFIALFGIIIMIGCLANQKIGDVVYEAESKKIKDDVDEWEKKICAPYELGDEIQEMLLNGKHVDEVYDELLDDFKFIFGENVVPSNVLCLKRDVRISNDILYSNNRIYSWCYNLLLSHRGKISRLEWLQGFYIGNPKNSGRDVKICQRIEHNLIKAGCDVRLYQLPHIGIDKEHKWMICGSKIVPGCKVVGESRRLWD